MDINDLADEIFPEEILPVQISAIDPGLTEKGNERFLIFLPRGTDRNRHVVLTSKFKSRFLTIF